MLRVRAFLACLLLLLPLLRFRVRVDKAMHTFINSESQMNRTKALIAEQCGKSRLVRLGRGHWRVVARMLVPGLAALVRRDAVEAVQELALRTSSVSWSRVGGWCEAMQA